MALKIFLHGLESSNRGKKAVYFQEKFPGITIPYFRGSLQERMEKLNAILAGKSGIRLVGSSFGGLMAALFTKENESRVARLILLAPAINLMGSAPDQEKKITVPVWVYHGKNDELIPLKEVEKVAKSLFQELSFHTLDDDHFLHKSFEDIDWKKLLL